MAHGAWWGVDGGMGDGGGGAPMDSMDMDMEVRFS